MRSVVVVLPASMWAMMPKLRYLSIGVVRATGNPCLSTGEFVFPPVIERRLLSSVLPAVVREGLVGFCHTMSFFALLDGAAVVFRGFQQFGGELARHGVLATLARGIDQPAHRQRGAAR